MKIVAIDYVGNTGGGMRFAVELMAAMFDARSDVELEVVSFHHAASNYRTAFYERGLHLRVREIPPANVTQLLSRRIAARLGVSGLVPARVTRIFPSQFATYEALMPPADVYWFPWMQNHQPFQSRRARVCATLHDVIGITHGYVYSPHSESVADELSSLRGWLKTSATIFVTSRNTIREVERLAPVDASRFVLVPLSGAHQLTSITTSLPFTLPARYLLCPANLAVHKNIETAIAAHALWGGDADLVLVGPGTELIGSPYLSTANNERAQFLSRWLSMHEYRRDRVIGLGYLANEQYSEVLRRAWAVVVPTLAEGGGSFPVEEALRIGKPVFVSDIPVMREHMNRIGGKPFWFIPSDAKDLGRTLTKFECANCITNFPSRSNSLPSSSRTWAQVANSYLRVMESSP